jgi:hypothetical protein
MANTEDEWNGNPFFLDISRCVKASEYTAKAIVERYGTLSPTQADEILRFPCLFAYETQCQKDPKFGFIRKITKRPEQKQIKILYEIIQVSPFLTQADLKAMHFELDIHSWEYNRTHWAIKDVDLLEELAAKGIAPSLGSQGKSTAIIEQKKYRDTLFFREETREHIEAVPPDLEREIGRGREPLPIFFCYAHEDEELLNELKKHLRPLQQLRLIDIWYDRDIQAGVEWEEEVKSHLHKAKIIFLLVSADFMASDYCQGIEMKQALERHNRHEACVIPLILRPTHWHDLLGHLQALPMDAKPVIDRSWHNQDEAWYDVVAGIRRIVDDYRKMPSE